MTAVLVLIVAVTLSSTANKYFTAFQWASWQEALQGAESGADLAMNAMRNDANPDQPGVPWVGWRVGKYGTPSKTGNRPPTMAATEYTIAADGLVDKNGNLSGGGSTAPFTLAMLGNATTAKIYDYITYSTSLTPHGGEGNTNLRVTATVDAPSSLTKNGQQWLRVRASGSTDLSGPKRVSEEKLDNRLRKLAFFFDRVLGTTITGNNSGRATRQIELVAKPVGLFTGALTAMVQIKNDKNGMITDSFNSEDRTTWPLITDPLDATQQVIDMTVSHSAASGAGKNGDIGSNAFPIKHDKSAQLDINADVVWGDVGNNYSQIKGLDPAYYNTSYDPTSPSYGLNNGGYTTANPNTALIKATGDGDVSGDISTNYYRDLPPIKNPSWASASNWTKIDKGTADVTASSDPQSPTRIIVSGDLTLGASDKWAIKPSTTTSNKVTTPVESYIEIWVKGNIKLDDGGAVTVQDHVHTTIYFSQDVKIGETKENKTNGGGFDNQSDDAKNLMLLGITETDPLKKKSDQYVDPLGNGAVYTPYKASGNIVFKESDFTGAIYAPDHNIVFDATKDGKGKRKKRKQDGNDFYGSFIGRTINSKQAHNFHYDESLTDAGPVRDYGYVSWFEDVDVNNR